MTSSSLLSPDDAWTYLHSFGHTIIARADKVPCHPEPPHHNLIQWQVKKNQTPLPDLLAWKNLRGIIPGTYGLVVLDVDYGDPKDLIAIAPPSSCLRAAPPVTSTCYTVVIVTLPPTTSTPSDARAR